MIQIIINYDGDAVIIFMELIMKWKHLCNGLWARLYFFPDKLAVGGGGGGGGRNNVNLSSWRIQIT